MSELPFTKETLSEKLKDILHRYKTMSRSMARLTPPKPIKEITFSGGLLKDAYKGFGALIDDGLFSSEGSRLVPGCSDKKLREAFDGLEEHLSIG